MRKYVDGYVVPVRKKQLAEYKRMARFCAKVWREHGALEVVECLADDVAWGKRTSFPRSVKLQDDEVTVFSWIAYKSRAARDRCNKAVMADKRMHKYMKPGATMPFDPKRMIMGGFKVMVQG